MPCTLQKNSVDGIENIGLELPPSRANVIEAAKAAKAKGMAVIGLTGRGGGNLTELCDVVIDVPWNGFADRVQEVHIKVIHAWIDLIERQQ